MSNRRITSPRATCAVAFVVIFAFAGWGRAQSCTVSATPLDFATYLPGSNTDSNGTVTVGCTGGAVAMGVTLDAGAYSAGSFAPRMMQSAGGAKLDYNLYVDGSYSPSSIWGDGSAGTVVNSGSGIFTVYGRIPAGQAVPPGDYSDTVITTVNF